MEGVLRAVHAGRRCEGRASGRCSEPRWKQKSRRGWPSAQIGCAWRPRGGSDHPSIQPPLGFVNGARSLWLPLDTPLSPHTPVHGSGGRKCSDDVSGGSQRHPPHTYSHGPTTIRPLLDRPRVLKDGPEFRPFRAPARTSREPATTRRTERTRAGRCRAES